MAKEFKLPLFLLLIVFILIIYYIFLPNFQIKISASDGDDFKWGVSLNPYPTGIHEIKILDKVLSQAKDLGVKWFRMEISNDLDNPFDLYDPVVRRIIEQRFNLVVIFQPSQDYEKLPDPYQSGYEQAYNIASRYPKVKFYQLGNEPAAGALKANWSGASDDSYSPEKYQKVLLWLKGASKGVKKANPYAKRIITGHWLNFGFFQKLQKDSLDYEIIGWDWFEEERDIATVGENGDPLTLLDHLKNFQKELWIMEVGTTGRDTKKQAEYLDNFITTIQKQIDFKALFMGVFYDQIHLIGSKGEYDGIVGLAKDSQGNWILGTPKPAYNVYKNFIRNKKQ